MISSRTRIATAALAAAFLFSCASTTPPPADHPSAALWRARAEAKKAKKLRMETGTADDPDQRDRWYWEQRAYPAGYIPVDVHRAAVRSEVAKRPMLQAGEAAWSSLGPAPLLDITYGLSSAQNTSGRTLTLAIHPNDENTLLIGTAQGGIWKSTDRGAHWRSVGELSLPTLAVNVIKYSPNDPNVLFAGTGEPNGSSACVHGYGLLRSRDGGESWELLPSKGDGWNFEYSAVSGLAFDARDANTMYVTTATVITATAFFRTPPNQPPSGVYKSTDGGQSWTMLRAATRYNINGAPSLSAGFMDLEYGGAKAPDTLYVSELFGGLLKSVNGGASWDYITPRKAAGFGALPAPVAALSYYDFGSATFKHLTRFLNPETIPDVRRIELGMSQSNPDILYAGVDSPTNRLDWDGNGSYDTTRGDRSVPTGLLYKSEDGGATWRWLGTVRDGIPNYCDAQCTYDNVITVNPNDPNDIFIGGSANYDAYLPEPLENPVRRIELPWRGMIYRSTDGGRTWLDTTPHCTRINEQPSGEDEDGVPVYTCANVDPTKVIHPDIHNIYYGPSSSIYVVNDGGIYRTTIPRMQSGSGSGGKRRSAGIRRFGPLAGLSYTWENLNNDLSTLQFYRAASHPTDPNIILGGMQDNSAGYWDGTKWEGWGAGDGTIAIFDPLDPRHVYLGSQRYVHRHDGGGEKNFSDTSAWHTFIYGFGDMEQGESVSFVPVFAVDPVQPNITYGGSDKGIYRSIVRGEGSRRVLKGQNTDGVPMWISVSPVDHRVVWAGTSTGAVYRYFIDGSTESVTRVDGSLPNRSVSRVLAGNDSATTVYVVLNGYDANTPAQPGKVFVSTDSGATWRNISGGLPDVPAVALAVDPLDKNRMWLATDTAVFSSVDGGTSWTSIRKNMPVVAIQDMHYNANTGYLVAATHGRGVWRMAVGGNAASEER